MKKSAIFFVALFFLAASQLVIAQNDTILNTSNPKTRKITVEAYNKGNHLLGFSPNFGGGYKNTLLGANIWYAYALKDRYVVGLNVNGTYHKHSFGKSYGYDIGAFGRYHFNQRKFSPFIQIGGGYVWDKYQNDVTNSNFTRGNLYGQIGVGFNWMFTKRVGLHFIPLLFNFNYQEKTVLWSSQLGLTISIGGKK